jgi:hypothetical protein
MSFSLSLSLSMEVKIVAVPVEEAEQSVVTGRTTHEIYVVEGGRRRWVPDLWTMNDLGLSPSDLQILDDEALYWIPEDAPYPSTVPSPRLQDGEVVESENKVYKVVDGRLDLIDSPRVLSTEEDFRDDKVVYLPASLIRALLPEQQPDQGGARA